MSGAQAKLAFECLEVAKEFHPFILGPHGSRTKAISEQTGARINVPPPSLMKNEITVAGDKEGVAQAVPMIKKIYTDMVSGHGGVAWGLHGELWVWHEVGSAWRAGGAAWGGACMESCGCGMRWDLRGELGVRHGAGPAWRAGDVAWGGVC